MRSEGVEGNFTDIVILGAGVTGLLAAIALAKAGFTVCLIGQPDLRPTSRTVALLDASVQMLRNLGLWDAACADGAALKIMRVVDDTGSLFARAPVDFNADEIGLEQFGFNISLEKLTASLVDAAQAEPSINFVRGTAEHLSIAADHVTATLHGGRNHRALLLVGADGRLSLARQSAGIAVREWHYPQTAMTTVLIHRQPHRNTSTEFQTRAGPCTLVPMPAQDDGLHRSSLVWLMAPGEAERRSALPDAMLAREIEQQTKHLLGAMSIEGVRSTFPMSGLTAQTCTAPRIALVGEAAHVFPPIGAQGLNLGLRDVGDLVDCLGDNKAARDAGDPAALDRFGRLRQGDIAARSLFVDTLNRSLLTPMLSVDFIRAAGLTALAQLGPLRRTVMRAGVSPQRVASLLQARRT